MWPIQVACLNLPREMRYKVGSIFLLGIIPGPKEPENIDPYLDIFVDEVVSLDGMKLYNAYKEEEFYLKVKVVLNVLDYPSQSKVFHCQGECVVCIIATYT